MATNTFICTCRKQSLLWSQGDLFYGNTTGEVQSSINGNICHEDGVNNNMEISVVKCRISNTANDIANANQTSNSSNDNRLDKLIAEIDSINFDEVVSSSRTTRYGRAASQAFTQGDYLNEIKLNRKKLNPTNSGCHVKGTTTSSSKTPTSTASTIVSISRPMTRHMSAVNSSLPRIVKLDPNKYANLHRNFSHI